MQTCMLQAPLNAECDVFTELLPAYVFLQCLQYLQAVLLIVLQEASAEELAILRHQVSDTSNDGSGCTALHYAAAAHKVKLVAQLLQLGADVNALTRKQPGQRIRSLTPLHLACLGRVKSNKQMRELLNSAGHLYELAVSICALGKRAQRGIFGSQMHACQHFLLCMHWISKLGSDF